MTHWHFADSCSPAVAPVLKEAPVSLTLMANYAQSCVMTRMSADTYIVLQLHCNIHMYMYIIIYILYITLLYIYIYIYIYTFSAVCSITAIHILVRREPSLYKYSQEPTSVQRKLHKVVCVCVM